MEQQATRQLRCRLDSTEKLTRGERVAELNEKVLEENASFESVKKEHNGIVGDWKSEMATLLDEIKHGELRSVDCTEAYDFTQNRVVVTRNDTGEVVEERQMTSEDRQTRMQVVD